MSDGLRKILLEALDGDEGWQDEFKPGSFGCHEALDRTSLIGGLVDDLMAHPAILMNAEWYRFAEAAAEALHELYDAIGSEHLGKGA